MFCGMLGFKSRDVVQGWRFLCYTSLVRLLRQNIQAILTILDGPSLLEAYVEQPQRHFV